MQALHCQPNRLTSFTQPGEEARRAEGQFWGNTYLSTPHLSDRLWATVAAFSTVFLPKATEPHHLPGNSFSCHSALLAVGPRVCAADVAIIYTSSWQGTTRSWTWRWRHPAPLTQVLPWFVTRLSKYTGGPLRNKRGRSACENMPARAVWETADLSLHCYRTVSSLKRLFWYK